MKQLIINADDFGFCSSISRGIIEGHQKGIITSTTIMANMPGFSEAVKLERENPSLGVGVHLNLCRGKPLVDPDAVSSLVNPEGNFWSPLKLLAKIYLKKINPKELEKELKAQIEKAHSSGIQITHLDSEKHFHMFPIISEVVLKLASYFNIPKIRLPREVWKPKRMDDLISSRFYKMKYLAFRSHTLASFFQREKIKFVDHFYGILYSSKPSLSAFLRILENIPSGISELMVHPGFIDQEFTKLALALNNSLLSSRQKELEILTHPKVCEKLKELNIKLINYSKL